MRQQSRSITWQGQVFRFERLQPGIKGDKPFWAVSRREFIGTMRGAAEITTAEFDVRGLRWLGELLGMPNAKPGR